ncbi:5-hydroxytryptamine receptor 1F-like [Saccoglossus kowalevskii]|uniref:5-hydroxytryptamine receptor 1A-like n=1 Tax=Saccoglossus kowalevskii TaxID=10224 RepID=A0ABM0ML00_SACKO|nr:PREDICTED: 5-hydroxytryptamine receptor 1A-like [Saccoglossus kowalevskii]
MSMCINDTHSVNCSGNWTNSTILFENSPPYSVWQAVLITLLLGTVILLTIIGNWLVVLSVCLVRKLRTPANYLYVSLAVSDLSIAILVMPLALVKEISGTWMFGEEVCDMWIAFDVTICTSSILTLCMISVDRYLAITRPFKYLTKRTPRLMAVMITTIWVASALISLPPIFGWGNGNVHADNDCLVSQDYAYTIYSTFGAFYAPLTVMIVIYAKLYRAADLLRRADIKQNRAGMFNPRKPKHVTKMVKTNTKNAGYENVVTFHVPKECKHRHGANISMTGERKAAKTLGVIMGAFILCWLPFFILALLRPFCNCEIPLVLNGCFLWLGYCNSMLNPVIYAMFNRDFRRPFRLLLTCRWKEVTKASGNQSVKLALKLMAEEKMNRRDSDKQTSEHARSMLLNGGSRTKIPEMSKL